MQSLHCKHTVPGNYIYRHVLKTEDELSTNAVGHP